MEKTSMVIKPDYSKVRNEFHFNVQRKYRSAVYTSKKVYNRKRLGKCEY